MIKDKFYFDRKFETIFRDCIYFTTNALDALESEDYRKEEHYSRAAILNLSILTEVAANCLLETLELPDKIFKEVDKFAPVTKIEFYLWEKKKIKLDRGCEEVQHIQELQFIRNFMVHPKSKKAEWKSIDENTMGADLGKTQLLKIPFSGQEWQGDDPYIALRVVMAFFDYVFRILCKYEPGEVQHLLFSSGDYIEGSKHGFVIYHEWKSIQKRWSLRMRFLGVECDVETNI